MSCPFLSMISLMFYGSLAFFGLCKKTLDIFADFMLRLF